MCFFSCLPLQMYSARIRRLTYRRGRISLTTLSRANSTQQMHNRNTRADHNLSSIVPVYRPLTVSMSLIIVNCSRRCYAYSYSVRAINSRFTMGVIVVLKAPPRLRRSQSAVTYKSMRSAAKNYSTRGRKGKVKRNEREKRHDARSRKFAGKETPWGRAGRINKI